MAPVRVAASPVLPEVHKVAVLQSKLNSLPALRSGENPEVQHIYIHCAEQEEAQELASFCQSSRRPKLVPEIVQEPGLGVDFDPLLRRCVPKVPPPYASNEWEEFSQDALALLFASKASRRFFGQKSCAAFNAKDSFYQHLQTMRWPALFVTDRIKLAHALSDLRVRAALGLVLTLQPEDVLPVVLAADFGVLTGNLVSAPPLDACESLALKIEILNTRASELQSWAPSQQGRKLVTLQPGIYMQRPEANADDTRFGARALALFGNQQCVYSAISPDGIRSVELSGTWDVVNGNLVLYTADQHTVSHISLHGSNDMQLSDVTYSEVVHISLEEFETDFVPLSLADCLPDGSEHLYTGLVESEEFPRESVEMKSEGTESEVDPSEFDAETSKMRNERTQVHLDTSELSGSFASTMDRRKPPTLTDVASNFSPRQKESPQSMQTPQHALNRIATEMVMGWGGKDAVRRSSGSSETLAFPPSPAPRLLGKDRRITKVSSMPWIKSCKPVSTSLQSSPIFATHGHVTLTGGLQFVHALQYLNTFVPYSCKTLDGKLTGRSFTTSLLQPGTYSYIIGVPEKDDFRSLEIVLHADGSCKYHEIVNGSTMRSTCGATVWRVDKTMLIVDTKKASAHGLSLREARGTRMVERRVRSIKIPSRVIQQYCTYEPFAQQQVPFPGHNPVDESERIFGLIDPNSPVLRSMKCRPDRLPYLAFEQELRRHGLPCDNIVSDFHFLDRDEDGQISVRDMRGLETYGNPVAAPEVIDELREALLTRFGGLDSAFDALVGDASAGCVDFDDFEAFLVTSAEDSPGKRVAGSSQKIKEWVTNTNVEDRKAVFASLNPNHDHGIDLTDFMSLNLHAAVVALRRLEHFQGWISEQFGQSAEAYVHIFRAIDKEQSQLLSRKVFAEGLLRLGYPCSVWASSIFALLDLNFSGELSVNNFKKLCDFNAAKMLMSLQDLKMVVDEKFKGVSECFQWLLQREMILQGASRLPRTVSFKTFHAMCRKVKFAPGLGSKRPDMNLRMLFLFLDVASGKPRSDGFLTKNEWSLLMGLNSRSLAGSPARLRRILEQKYGGMDQAFETMHTAWLERALPRGLRHTALTRLARVLLTAISSPSSHHTASPKSRKSKHNLLPSVRAPSAVPRQSKVGRLSTSVSLPELSLQHLQSAGGKVARARH